MFQVLQILMFNDDRPDALFAQKAAEQSFMAETIMRCCKEFGILTYFYDVRCIYSLPNRTVCTIIELIPCPFTDIFHVGLVWLLAAQPTVVIDGCEIILALLISPFTRDHFRCFLFISLIASGVRLSAAEGAADPRHAGGTHDDEDRAAGRDGYEHCQGETLTDSVPGTSHLPGSGREERHCASVIKHRIHMRHKRCHWHVFPYFIANIGRICLFAYYCCSRTRQQLIRGRGYYNKIFELSL